MAKILGPLSLRVELVKQILHKPRIISDVGQSVNSSDKRRNLQLGTQEEIHDNQTCRTVCYEKQKKEDKDVEKEAGEGGGLLRR